MLQQHYDDEDIQFEGKWKQKKTMWTETCNETVDRKEAQYKDMMYGETLRKVTFLQKPRG